MTQTTPECLTRTAADDRAEAWLHLEDGAFDDIARGRLATYDESLAAIQRREAEAVMREAHIRNYFSKENGAILTLAWDAAALIHRVCQEEHYGAAITLAQRATLLDAARALVRLALEVAQ